MIYVEGRTSFYLFFYTGNSGTIKQKEKYVNENDIVEMKYWI